MTTSVLEIEGCFNFRDAGGWPTAAGMTMRPGVLYRGDAPERLTADGRAAVEALGLTCVVDLRQKRFVGNNAPNLVLANDVFCRKNLNNPLSI